MTPPKKTAAAKAAAKTTEPAEPTAPVEAPAVEAPDDNEPAVDSESVAETALLEPPGGETGTDDPLPVGDNAPADAAVTPDDPSTPYFDARDADGQFAAEADTADAPTEPTEAELLEAWLAAEAAWQADVAAWLEAEAAWKADVAAAPQPDPATVTLEPAPLPPPPPEPIRLPTVADTGVARILRHDGDIDYFDQATGETPDPETLFVKPWEYGSVVVCQKRLIERVYVGPYMLPTERLLLPAGAQISQRQADAIVNKLREQIAAVEAAQADEPVEPVEPDPDPAE